MNEFSCEVIRLYQEEKSSIRNIAKKLGCSASKVRNNLLKNNINLRSSKEGLRLFMENDIPLTKYLSEVITGELLGDGSLNPRTHQSSFAFGNKYQSYTQYLWNIFNKLNMCISQPKKDTYYHKYHKKWYTRYIFKTISTIQLHNLEKEWYIKDERRIKVLPDIKITPTTMLHWYLGDGSLPGGKFAILCSENFTKEENIILSDLINKEILIKSSIFKYINRYRILIPKTSVPQLLEYIGISPIQELDYKWNLQPIGRIMEPIYIDRNILYKLYIIENWTQNKIANYFSCSKTLITKKLRQYQIRKRPCQIDPQLILTFKNKVFNQNKSIAQMARELECSAHTIDCIIEYLDIPFNRKSSYMGEK